jgi:glucose/arabinose dehydrogenase
MWKMILRRGISNFLSLVAGAVVFVSAAVEGEGLPQIRLERVFPALKAEVPLWMCQAPNDPGHFFVVLKEGRVLIVPKGSDGSQPDVFFDISDRHPSFDNEDGLLSLAFHPQFSSNGLFYVFYTQKISGRIIPIDRYRCLVSEFQVTRSNRYAVDMASERILLDVREPNSTHKGGEIGFGPDGYLYIGLGDGSGAGDPDFHGQNPCTLMGKILRIDVNHREPAPDATNAVLPYAIPADNPFVGEPDYGGFGARREIYAWGLRNPWRFSWDRATGDLWCGDVGQERWEEVDLIVKGGNYGWSTREGFHFFRPGPEGARYNDPVIEFAHDTNLLSQSPFPKHAIGTCVIGGYVYRGVKYPALQGVYFYADYTLGTIFGLRRQNGKVAEYGIVARQPKNIISFAEDAEGEIYALALDGGIFTIVPQ